MTRLYTALSAIAVSLLIPSSSAKACAPLGAVLPAPQAPSEHPLVQSAIEGLTAALEEIASGKLNTSAVSIGVKSIHEDSQLFGYHFTPPVNSGIGTEEVDENTIYRVGSVSKMMPALAVLQNENINLDDSVLVYLPELENATNSDAVNAIAWKDVTVRSLANHLGGLATDFAMDLAIFPTDVWLQMGLPEVPRGTGPTCSGLPGTRACTKEDLIKDVNRRNPVFLPQSSPVYSNLGYAILGLVVEAATGEKFEDVVQANIFDVAGMDSTSFFGPVDSFEEDGFVPVGESTWNATLGVFEAAGGMFSSTKDLVAFAEAIHTNQFLSPVQTRAWMKPDTHTSSLGFSVGNGWEILRSDNITSDGRVIDVYTKSGDLGLYHALVGIVPDYDIVISVLTAGVEVSMDAYARSKFFSAVVQNLLPAVEAAGREEAERFEGTFTEEESNSTLVLSSDSGTGLLIESFHVRGFDVLNNIGSYSLSALESGGSSNSTAPPPPAVEGRLYPTERKSASNDSTTTAWRAIFGAKTDEQDQQIQDSLFWLNGRCETWFGADRSAYNFLSLSDFHIVEGSDGAVQAITNPAFNVTLTKVSNGTQEGSQGDGENSGEETPQSASSLVQVPGLAVFVLTVLTVVNLL